MSVQLGDVNQSIEGDPITGQSRKPLNNRGWEKLGDRRINRFVAKFDVKAKVSGILANGEKVFKENSHCDLEDNVFCEAANIISEKNKYSTAVKKGSATHKTNFWSFPQHTMVEVTRSHSEIQDAIQKREDKQKLS
jgi:hypothetical protein